MVVLLQIALKVEQENFIVFMLVNFLKFDFLIICQVFVYKYCIVEKMSFESFRIFGNNIINVKGAKVLW
jgi:hypothetical protein